MKSLSLSLIFTSLIIIFPADTLCKKQKTPEIIKSHSNISSSSCLSYIHDIVHIRNITGKKIVNYFYLDKDADRYSREHLLSPEDAAIYEKNNMIAIKTPCELGAKVKVQKANVAKVLLGLGNSSFTWHAFTLISDTRKKIDIYISRIFGCDAKFYATPYKGRIAILIDEEGYIVSILDDIKSEDDIYTAFGIK